MTHRPTRHAATPPADALPKLCGGDIELGNAIVGLDQPNGTCAEAALALLREIEGLPGPPASAAPPVSTWPEPGCGADYAGGSWDTAPATARGTDATGAHPHADDAQHAATRYDPQDFGRKYLPANGGCVYIDLGHCELCLPEVLSAHDHVAAWHAMLRIAQDAQRRADLRLPPGHKLEVLVNNSDGQDNSYGSHQNFLITRRCFNDLFYHRLHYLLFLASCQASSIVLTGAGKVGSENDRPPVDYQISQRADFLETLTGPQTTFHRPIVNSRNESLCGPSYGVGPAAARPGARMARLHVIFFDNTLCHVACLLKVGMMQILLAMIEQGVTVPGLILENPLLAVLLWSRDPSLRARARLLSGPRYSALDHQMATLEHAQRFVDAGRADGIVPRARDILALCADTLGKLRAFQKSQSIEALTPLARRLDWVLKRRALERALGRRGLPWDSPQAKRLDHAYSSLDPADGLYWAFERAGVVEKVVSDGQIERFVHQPPANTRAWLRAHLLRRTDPDALVDIDWDNIRFRFADDGADGWPTFTYWTLPMGNPLLPGRQCQALLDGAPSLRDAIVALGAQQTDYHGRPLAPDRPARAASSYLPVRVEQVADAKDSPTIPSDQGGEDYGLPREEK